MEVQPTPPTIRGPADWFAGDVYIDSITAGRYGEATSVLSVHFCPGGHTAWHRDSVGQTLHVTDGVGFVQSRGGPLVTIRPRDVVRIGPGEERWHGAGPGNLMTHIALTEGDTQWGDHLTEEEYPATPSGPATAPEAGDGPE